MLAYRYPMIAREGWGWIAVVLAAAVITQIFYGLASIPLFFLFLLLLFLFRDPYREVPASPLGIVCPVDGRIVAIDKVHDAYVDRSAICISVRMGLSSVYSVHSPMEGKIIEQWLKDPRKIQFVSTESSQKTATDVRAFAQWIQSDEGDDVVMVMEATSLTPWPHCYAHSGERIGQGQRCGFLRFGTRVDVLLPVSTRIDVNVGDKVLGGSVLIASLVRASVESQATADEAVT